MRRALLLIVLVLATAVVVFRSDDASATSDAGAPDARAEGAAGRLPPTVIQHIVRANFGRFKLCYTTGLRKNPNLAGRVHTRFVIDTTGHVSSASDDPGSDLPDMDVRKCIIDGFKTLEFPPPEGGIVTVVYPLIFTPHGADAGP